jgi:hypothetical protein
MVVGMLDIIARGRKDVWIKKPKDHLLGSRKRILNDYILKVFRKHTPVIQETRVMPFSGTNFGKQAKIVIPNFCDLYSDIFLQLNIQSFLKNPDELDLRDYSPKSSNDNFGYTQYLAYSCIERIQLYAGKTKIDEYTGLEIFHKSVERFADIQRRNLRRKTGYYPQATPTDHSNVYQNQGGDLFLRIPFDLISKYRPLPTIMVQASPLEIRIQFRKLEKLIYPAQDMKTLSQRSVTYEDASGNEVTFELQKPRIKFAYLHVEGLHVEQQVRDQLQFEITKTNIIPFVTYDTQEFLFVDPTYTQNQFCIGTTQKIPAPGAVADFPLPLEFQNPVQNFTLYTQLQSNIQANLYHIFLINNSLQNSQIITRIGLQVHGQTVYPKLRSQFYTQVTPYTCQSQNIVNQTYVIPFNIYNQDTLFNYGYIDYGKVNHSTMDLELTGWDAGENNRTTKLYIIAKIYRKLEAKNGTLVFHSDF